MALAPILVAVALAAAQDPGATPSPEVKEQVRALLGAIHGPVSPEAFRALGPGADEALAEVAREEGFPSRRLRALEALAGLGGARAEAVHREVLASPKDRDPVVRAAAAEALAAAAPADACGRIRARAGAEAVPSRFARALTTCERADRAGAPGTPAR